MQDEIKIDAQHASSHVLTSVLSLAALTTKAVCLEGIRNKKAKPGLRQRHLECARALSAICNGELEGDEVGSTRLRFVPGAVVPGDYHFDLEGAGATGPLLQALLWPLASAPGKSKVLLGGATHVAGAPTFSFQSHALAPLLRRMGLNIELELVRYGFAPAGGGQIVAEIAGGSTLRPIEVTSRGRLNRRLATAVVCNLPGTIATRELKALREALSWKNEYGVPRIVLDADGPGNVIVVELVFEQLTEVFTLVGGRERSAEQVAEECAQKVQNYLRHDIPVSAKLAEELIVPFAMAGGGRFVTEGLSTNSLTTLRLLREFVSTTVELEESSGNEDHERVTLRFFRAES